MSSKLAMEKHTGKLAEYRASEGKVTFVEEKKVVFQIKFKRFVVVYVQLVHM